VRNLVLLIGAASLLLTGCKSDEVSNQDVDNWQKAKGGVETPVEEGRDR